MENFEYKVGGSAYFQESWTDEIIGGEILEVKNTQPTERNPKVVPYLVIKTSKYGKRDALAKNCYPTREDALKAQHAAAEAKKARYRAEIHSIEDLVAFMYDHHVSCCEEYTDWEARTVARQKAKELLGIKLDR